MMYSDEQSTRVCIRIHPDGNLLSHAPMSIRVPDGNLSSHAPMWIRVLVLNDHGTRSRGLMDATAAELAEEKVMAEGLIAAM